MSVLTPDEIMMCYIKNRIQEWKELTKKNRANSRPGKLDDTNNAKAEQVIDDLAVLSTAINHNTDAFEGSRRLLYKTTKQVIPMLADALFNLCEKNKAVSYRKIFENVGLDRSE